MIPVSQMVYSEPIPGKQPFDLSYLGKSLTVDPFYGANLALLRMTRSRLFYPLDRGHI